jgi:hypothetical protein
VWLGSIAARGRAGLIRTVIGRAILNGRRAHFGGMRYCRKLGRVTGGRHSAGPATGKFQLLAVQGSSRWGIYALSELKASEGLLRLRQLLSDQQRSNFDKQETVSEAAQKAIATLPSETGR